MALGKRCNSMKVKREVVNGGEGAVGFEFASITRSFSFGRKRILITTPNISNIDSDSSPFSTPLKRQCSDAMNLENIEKSALECLPHDVLVRVLCAVDHEDLKQLFQVSKVIREATLVAKQWHFAYSTPRKTRAFRDPVELENESNFDEIDAPNAPKRSRQRSFVSRLNKKNLADVSVALFASDDGNADGRGVL
ncbi:hypothetical protein Tsubulata_028992 [Turnera subulata]|uniref:F-box domain-containing protein n=1 Tax=Turnera subulata TaxID=218843 RepID=A0A9Q0F6P3_9ROSI|nr:hypothetical protein Tsubulata_028992 [Turnera subulata]